MPSFDVAERNDDRRHTIKLHTRDIGQFPAKLSNLLGADERVHADYPSRAGGASKASAESFGGISYRAFQVACWFVLDGVRWRETDWPLQ